MSRIARIGLLASCAAAALVPVAARAQQGGAERTAAALEEVVVTATRRDERLQEVPIAVTAITSEEMERRKITDIKSIQTVAPSLTIMPFPNDPTAVTFSMRGQAMPGNAITQDPAVGVYVDGVYSARASGGNLALGDLERIEVLRGPQGTLFGRNTIGGAINVVSKDPTSRYEGMVAGEYGNYDELELGGVLNVPLSDKLAIRAAYKHSEHGGYARSYVTGEGLDQPNNDIGRLKIRFEPFDGWTFLTTGDYSDSRNGGEWLTLVDIPATVSGAPNSLFTLPARLGKTDDLRNYINPYLRRTGSVSADGRPAVIKAKVRGVSETITGEIVPGVTGKSITAYRRLDRKSSRHDLDGTPYVLVSASAVPTFPPSGEWSKQFSQELQLYGDTLDNRLKWIVGGYYSHERAYYESYSYSQYPVNPSASIGDGDVWNKSLAAYGQVNFKITEALQLTAGVRYSKDDRRLVTRNRTTNPVTGVVTPQVPTSSIGDVTVVRLPSGIYEAHPKPSRESYWPWTVGLDYKAATDVLLYAKVSRGYRAGGFNVRAADATGLIPFGPESALAYEIGVKSEFLDHRVRFNGSLYRTNYDNIQLAQTVPTGLANPPSTNAIRNAGKARIQGGEAELTGLFGPVRLGGTLGYTDAQFTEFKTGVTGATLASGFDGVPKWTATLFGEYTTPTPWGDLELHADYDYKGSMFTAYVPPANPKAHVDARGLWNAMATLNLDEHNTDVRLWVRNIADKKYLERAHDLVVIVVGYPGAPRTYGVTVTYRFGA